LFEILPFCLKYATIRIIMKQTLTLGTSTLYMTIASVGQKIVSFAYFAIIARTIGAENTGKYFFALSFTAMFVVLVDLGLTNVLVREAAKARSRLVEFLSSILGIKIILGVVSYGAMIALLHILGYDQETKILVYIAGITMLMDSIHITLYGTLRALGNVRYEAIGLVASQVATMVIGTICLYLGLPLYSLMIAFLIPSTINALYSYWALRIVFGIRIFVGYSMSVMRHMLPIAAPFALAAIFSRVFAYVDSVILSQLIGDIAVGWYSVPYKVAYAFQFIPFALIAGLYPRMSEYYAHDKKRLAEVFDQGLRYLLIVSIPIAIGIIATAPRLIPFLFGDAYLQSIIPLQILMVGVIAVFVNVELGALLNACDRQYMQTTLIGITMVLNIILNFVLIPYIGVAGAALAATGGNIFLTLTSWYVVHRTVRVRYAELGILITKLVISAGVMYGVIWYTTAYVHVLLQVCVGAIAFALCFVMLKTMRPREFAYLSSLISRK